MRSITPRLVRRYGLRRPRRAARLALEALDELLVAHELRRDQFERDETLRAGVRGEVDGAHAALPEQPLQPVLLVEHLTDVRLRPRQRAAILPHTGARISRAKSAPPGRSEIGFGRRGGGCL
jgi:hypothetical protein